MNIGKLKDQLIISEGVVYKTYNDILGLKTCGIGHLCREGEPEFELPLGAKISEERVTELFEQDIQTAINDCKKIYDDWDKLPETVQIVCCDMMFNLGYPRYSKFAKTISHIRDGEWLKASSEMLDSKWARQLPKRSKHLSEMMASVADE